MAKLEEEREKLFQEEMVPALVKSKKGEPLTIREEILVRGWEDDRPVVEGPWTIGYFPSEKDRGTLGGTIVPLKSVLLRRMSPKHMARVLAHEIGHSRHIDTPFGSKWGATSKERLRIEFWEELVANYFTLKFKPYNKAAMKSIRFWRGRASGYGLSEEEISKVEGEVMKEVGYKGRRVK